MPNSTTKVKYYTLPNGRRVYDISKLTGYLLQYNDTINENDFVIDGTKLYRVGKNRENILIARKYFHKIEISPYVDFDKNNPINWIKILYHKIIRYIKYKTRSNLKNK